MQRVKELTQTVRKKIKHGRETAMLREIDGAGNDRLRWDRLRWMKKEYTPKPYHIKDRHGTPVKLADKAEAKADYLAHGQWGKTNMERQEPSEEDKFVRRNNKDTYRTKVEDYGLEYNLDYITNKEVKNTIKHDEAPMVQSSCEYSLTYIYI